MSKLSREEIKKRRAQFSCEDYKPLPSDYKCQHYVKGGACSRPDYFMCVEWVKRNPQQAAAMQMQPRGSSPGAPTPEPAEPASASAWRRRGQADETNGVRAIKRVLREKKASGSDYIEDLSHRVMFNDPDLGRRQLRAVVIDTRKFPEHLDVDPFPVTVNRTQGGHQRDVPYGPN